MNKAEIYDEAAAVLQLVGHDADMMSDYSGRGMYGSTTPAIVSNASGPMVGWAVTVAVDRKFSGEKTFEDVLYLIPTRSDNMGLDMVYY